MSVNFYCYLLSSDANNRCTYIGATTCLRRRLRQHNGQLCGGARATQRYRPWRFVAAVSGFRTWPEALSFEWHWKRSRGLQRRMGWLEARLQESGMLRSVDLSPFNIARAPSPQVSHRAASGPGETLAAMRSDEGRAIPLPTVSPPIDTHLSLHGGNQNCEGQSKD